MRRSDGPSRRRRRRNRIANFNDATGKVPYPFDFYSSLGSAGRHAQHTGDRLPGIRLQSALNALDGWSTNAPSTRASAADRSRDRSSGDSVKIDQAVAGPHDQGAMRPAPPACPPTCDKPRRRRAHLRHRFHGRRVDPTIDSGGKFLRITPLKPLDGQQGPCREHRRTERRQDPQRRLPRRPYRRPQGHGRPGFCGRHPVRERQAACRAAPPSATKYQGLCAVTRATSASRSAPAVRASGSGQGHRVLELLDAVGRRRAGRCHR